uniref:G-protein coupled receptors family 1 profile domain-containing protein n=1 Tax=Romanomermis culicivorax TaxID=13658 RepID=A0A915IKV8_ROMCU
MLIVFVFTTAKIFWSITFSWQGGENMCKLIKFIESTIFQLSSNLIVCISLDRLLLIILRRKKALHYAIVDVIYCLAWFSAPVLHIWQLFLWTTMTPRPQDR